MKSLTEQFADFARSKPADEAYDAYDNEGCVIFQFLDEAGFRPHCVGWEDWYDPDHGGHKTPQAMIDAAAPAPHTFGALAQRLSA